MQLTIKRLLASLATSVTLLLSVFYLFASGTPFLNGVYELVKQIIPNLIASLIVFLSLYFFIDEYIGGIPTESKMSQVASNTKEGEWENFFNKNEEKFKNVREKLSEEFEKINIGINSILLALESKNSGINNDALEKQLNEWYKKKHDIAYKLFIVEQKIKIQETISSRDEEIGRLHKKIDELELKIAENKEKARIIVDNAERI